MQTELQAVTVQHDVSAKATFGGLASSLLLEPHFDAQTCRKTQHFSHDLFLVCLAHISCTTMDGSSESPSRMRSSLMSS